MSCKLAQAGKQTSFVAFSSYVVIASNSCLAQGWVMSYTASPDVVRKSH